MALSDRQLDAGLALDALLLMLLPISVILAHWKHREYVRQCRWPLEGARSDDGDGGDDAGTVQGSGGGPPDRAGGAARRAGAGDLFGSCATGHVHHFSDIDVAIDPVEPLPPGLLLDIAEALDDSTVPYFVDVVDLSQAGPDLRARVMQEGIRWTG